MASLWPVCFAWLLFAWGDGPQGRGYSSCVFRVGAACFPASISDAGGFDNARRFRVLLAREATWDEPKKRRLSYHAQKLLQEPALDGNFLQRPREQRVDVETRRVRRANASNIALPLAEPDRAIAALQELLSIPCAGALAANMPLTPVLLRLDPRFQKLVASPAPKQ